MSEAIETIFHKEFEARDRKMEEKIILRMLRKKASLDMIMDFMEVSPERIVAIAKANGLNTQTV